MNKTCNCIAGNCQYKITNTKAVLPECSYLGYCDYQLPKDSRGVGIIEKDDE